MSVLNQSGEEQVECPLCMEPLEVDDLHFYPCTCGYQICRFCWNRIREGENGLCPACRKAYPENPADFTPLSQEQVAAIKTEKKAREQKRRNKTLESRRALANVRVVQNNLVFVVGLPVRLADPEILKRQEYFGKYGKIHKVVINQSTTYAGSQGPSASAYVTYVSSADALRAIQGVNNVTLDGRVLKGSLGTTKYCANFMKNQPCPKPDCMYLHELGDPKASFTKEEMHAGLHQVYERKLHNQLLVQQQREASSSNSSGNSSTNADKGSPKDSSNPSNFIPTTVVTSSNINNVVNSTKTNNNNNNSKKESINGGSSTSSNGSTSSSNGTHSGKEAWPSLGSSPPSDSPARKQSSPKPQHSNGVKSQENGTSESSSPTQLTQQPAQTKIKDNDSKTSNSKKESSTNGQASKKSKQNDTKQNKKSNSTSEDDSDKSQSSKTHSVFENDTQYLSNELDELESDRHSLLENHDLLEDHSLLEDDNTHNLLNDANSDVIMMQRQREMLAGLVNENHMLPHMNKSPIVNGYGLIDRDMYLNNDRQVSQMNPAMMDPKELLLRERSRSEMLMRQNEIMARQHNVMAEPKHYMPTSSIGLESASELLGANYHQNSNILPPFGMRVDNSMSSSMSGAPASAGSMGPVPAFLMHGHQLMPGQQMQAMVNGFDSTQTNSEGRYLAENMDKFFTDFHKAQQMRALVAARASTDERRLAHLPHNMLSAERLEMEHKQRLSIARSGEGVVRRAAGDADDDLDFDPFSETQKALAEMMETEMMQSTVSSGDTMDRVRRSRMPPPGFSHVSPFGAPPRQHPQQQGYNTNSAMFSDWTQMDPAIMSTSVNFGNKGVQPQQPPPQPLGLKPQQQELFARFNQLSVQPNTLNKLQVPLMQGWGSGGAKLPWTGAYNSIPMPPGFAPPKPPQHPAECIDAK